MTGPANDHEVKHILVAEDLEGEIIFLRYCFEKAGVKVRLRFVRDGEEAIAYLEGSGQYENRGEHPFPSLLLLDLDMPRGNGFQVLECVRGRPGLKRLVVVVFSSSSRRADVNRAYDLGANSYVVKPIDVAEAARIGRILEEYWCGCNLCGDCE